MPTPNRRRGRNRACGTITTAEPGVLLLCTDGLWNYLPEAADIARFCSGHRPGGRGPRTRRPRPEAGGHDNITVAVIPIGGLHEFG